MGLSHTVSGDIASFRTPSRVPIESLKFHFLPKQADGTPSPENPIPIEGWTGVNGKRSSKNLAHVVGYSATNVSSSSANRQTENSYGTTISTVNYVSPDTALVVTQASTEKPDSPSSYKNGYFEVIVDNLELDKYYDVSFKITNVLSNPLNVSLENIKAQPPSGSSWSVSEVKNGNILIFRNKKFEVGNGPDRKAFTVKNCGMSFTISEFMVTPANKSDGVFEPYSGEQIPIVFPSNGKNLIDWPTPDGFSVSQSYFNGWSANWINEPIYVTKSNFGKRIIYSAEIDNMNGVRDANLHVWVKDKDGNYVHSSITSEIVPIGSSKRVYAVIPITYESWYEIYLGLTIGTGSVISHPMAEYSTSMTDYEPYSSDNTFYGGYYDPVIGEIVVEYEMITDAWKNWTVRGEALGNKIKIHRFNNLVNSVSGGGGICISNVAKKMWKDTEESNPHFYITYTTSTVPNYNSVHMFLPLDLDEDTIIQVLATLITPIHIPVAPQDLKAFLDHNNFWSDANDITEVTYAVTESKDMLATRKLAMDFDMGHHKKVKWNNLVNGYLSSDDWGDRDSNDTATTFENGVSETTFLTKKRTFYTMRSKNEPRVDLSHKYFAYAEYFFDESFSQLPQTGFEYAGGKTLYATPTSLGDGWYYVKGIVSGNRNGGGYMYIPFLLVNSETDSGQKVKTRNVLYMDLTLMFGEGKEPATSNELLKLFEINGINVHEPHSKDITGTDQWLIIP